MTSSFAKTGGSPPVDRSHPTLFLIRVHSRFLNLRPFAVFFLSPIKELVDAWNFSANSLLIL